MGFPKIGARTLLGRGLPVLLCLAVVKHFDCKEPEPLDLSRLVNEDLTTYTNGHLYPSHGRRLVLEGVTFELATFRPTSKTGILQLLYSQRSRKSSGPREVIIPVGRAGVTKVYLLMNSAFGACGAIIGALDFVGTRSHYRYSLVEGENIRDHNSNRFCNQATTVQGTKEFGGVRFDMQTVVLPSDFVNETLREVVFMSSQQSAGFGAPFIAAMSMATAIGTSTSRVLDYEETDSKLVPCIAGTNLQARVLKPDFCTPTRETISQAEKGHYYVTLPANLIAGIPNPTGLKIHLSNVRGTICWDSRYPVAVGCNGPDGNDWREGGPNFIAPRSRAGALIFWTEHGHTYFAVNGLKSNRFKNRSGFSEFKDHEGSFDFEVFLGRVPTVAQATEISMKHTTVPDNGNNPVPQRSFSIPLRVPHTAKQDGQKACVALDDGTWHKFGDRKCGR